MQTQDAIARMEQLQSKIAESNRIIAAAAEAQDDNPRPKKTAKSSSQVSALVCWLSLSASCYRVGVNVNLCTLLCLRLVSWTYVVLYRSQLVPPIVHGLR